MIKTAKITISLPQELVALADSLAQEKNINRSQVISGCLRDIAEKRKNESLKEGYLAMSKEHKKSAEYFREAQAEILPTWKNEDD